MLPPFGFALMLLLTVACTSTAAWGARHRQPKINPRRPGLASVAADAVQNRKEAGTAGSIGELAKCTSAQRLGTDFVGINAKSD